MTHNLRYGLSLLTALTMLLMLSVTSLAAQDIEDMDLDRWRNVAERSEAAVDDPDASSELMEALRISLVEFREEFDAARRANSTRIASLREQLALLGTPSTEENAAPEAAEVATKRMELEAQLADLTGPVQVADTAFARADGLVGEIDTIVRSRQAEALLEVVEIPLNPVHWPGAVQAMIEAVSKLQNDMTMESDFRRNLPLILLGTIGGLVLIMRGRRWSKMIVNKVRQADARGLGVWRFVISLLRIAFPLIGLWILSRAALATGYLGERGDQLMMLIPVLGGLMLGFRWVAELVFSRDDDEALIVLSQRDRAAARRLVGFITVMLIGNLLALRVLELDGAPTSAKTVIVFPFTVLISYAVYRIGRLLRHYGVEAVEADSGDGDMTRAGTLGRIIRFLGSLSIGVAIAAPLLHAAGYFNAATSLLFPFVVTLIIVGLVLALQRFSADVYGVVTKQGPAARETLMPILFGLLLFILVVPVIALVWGARVADLTELWAGFRRGFAVGDTRISPTDFITFAVIFTLGYLATRLAQSALKTNVLPKTKIDKGGQIAMVSGLGYVGIFLAALAAITGAGIDLSSLAIVAGALSVGIGFGLQNIVSNFVSGIILLIERPITEGDWIEVSGGQMGYVRDISVRSTRIETFDGTDVIVPNADLVSGTVTNYTRGNTLGRVIIPVGVAYGTDTKRVETILCEIANEQPMALADPAPKVLFVNFGASSLDFEIRMFLRDVNWMMAVKSDVNHAIAIRFAEEGIEIPFPQQDLWLRNPEALRMAPPEQRAAPKRSTPAGKSQAIGDAAKGEGDY
ncbi:MAG: DUF3772 domain-containing protein [Sulfitobacter sp.]